MEPSIDSGIKISIIIGFRDRDLVRVTYALESLATQSLKEFELIFIDYGSEEETAGSARMVVESYPFSKYLYSDTRGMLWNRAHALNTGLKLATGSVVLVSDIDLILNSSFLYQISSLDYNSSFYTFSCYYLPEGFALTSKDLLRDGIHYEQNYVGLCAVSRDKINSVSGFDEFYMVWGAEDDDLYFRLQKIGLTKVQLGNDTYPVFHQWHLKQAPQKPTLWYLTMVNYLYAQNRTSSTYWGKLLEPGERKVLNLVVNKKYKKHLKLELSENKLMLFNPIFASFNLLRSGEIAWFEYVEIPLNTKYQFNFFIKLLKSKQEINVEKHSINEISMFFQYFIAINRHKIEDYYIKELTSGTFLLILIKK